jgi:ribosomal-protein-alanine N-acetyltransferase
MGEDVAVLPPVRLSILRRRHLRSVLRIEGQVYPRPWSFALFMSELQMRTTRYYVGAWVGPELAGYAGMMLVADEGHVVNIAVDPVWQRRKVGTRLLANLASAALARGCRHLTLEVRVSNTAAQGLYRRFGFNVEGLRKNYYTDLGEDALVMWARNIDGPEYAELLRSVEAGLGATTLDQTAQGARR